MSKTSDYHKMSEIFLRGYPLWFFLDSFKRFAFITIVIFTTVAMLLLVQYDCSNITFNYHSPWYEWPWNPRGNPGLRKGGGRTQLLDWIASSSHENGNMQIVQRKIQGSPVFLSQERKLSFLSIRFIHSSVNIILFHL